MTVGLLEINICVWLYVQIYIQYLHILHLKYSTIGHWKLNVHLDDQDRPKIPLMSHLAHSLYWHECSSFRSTSVTPPDSIWCQTHTSAVLLECSVQYSTLSHVLRVTRGIYTAHKTSWYHHRRGKPLVPLQNELPSLLRRRSLTFFD